MPPVAATDLRIPVSSKTFLVEVGLPRKAELLLAFDVDMASVPNLAQLAADRGVEGLPAWQLLRRIGTDYGTELCLDEGNNGVLVGIDVSADISTPGRLVNSTVEQFAECLATFYRFQGTGVGMSGHERQAIVAAEEAELRRIDP